MKALAFLCIVLAGALPALAQYDTATASPVLRFLEDVSPIARMSDGSVDIGYTVTLAVMDGLIMNDLILTRRAFDGAEGRMDIEVREWNPLQRPLLENRPLDLIVRIGMTGFLNYCWKQAYADNPFLGYVAALATVALEGWANYRNYQLIISVGF